MLAGLYLNPAFFGSTDALFSVLRDASRYGVMAVGMTFVIVNKELDLSVGSTFGLTATIFGMLFAPTYFDSTSATAVVWCLVLGLAIGLINGVLVTVLEVPAFIATLTMLFIGRGVILGLTGGKNIAFEIKAAALPAFLRARRDQRVRLQQSDLLFVAHRRGRRGHARLHLDRLDDLRHRRQRAGGALRRHQHALRAHALLCALLALRGHRGADERRAEQGRRPAIGLGAELIAIASVIVGGAAIFGGRGRVIGSCLGAIFVGLIDKVLREGVPITRIDRRRRREDARWPRSRNCRPARCRPCSAWCSSSPC